LQPAACVIILSVSRNSLAVHAASRSLWQIAGKRANEMNSLLVAAFAGAWLMALSNDSISIEPGKQLPQTVTVRVAGNDGERDVAIRYMLYVPESYETEKKKWPLMLFLHGLGECSENDLTRVKIHGPPKFVDKRPDFPFVVVAPQLLPPNGGMEDVPKAWKPEPLIKLVDHVQSNLRIDRTRVYVTGLSMGGFGTWRLVAAYPERFAAALPICGGGEPATMARSLRRVPIWAFHGALDPTVPLERSQEMVDAVRRAGGDVRFTVYPKVAHDSWTETYDNQEVYDWLLSHRGPLK
jgi:predicted peptidase